MDYSKDTPAEFNLVNPHIDFLSKLSHLVTLSLPCQNKSRPFFSPHSLLPQKVITTNNLVLFHSEDIPFDHLLLLLLYFLLFLANPLLLILNHPLSTILTLFFLFFLVFLPLAHLLYIFLQYRSRRLILQQSCNLIHNLIILVNSLRSNLKYFFDLLRHISLLEHSLLCVFFEGGAWLKLALE